MWVSLYSVSFSFVYVSGVFVGVDSMLFVAHVLYH